MPRVSIIVPCYNASRWIRDTLDSALAQTHRDIEVIVVDDGSTDDSASIVGTFADPRIRLVASRNRGAAAARNLGLAQATGDYVQFLDADDMLSPDKVAAQVEMLAAEPPRRLATSGLVYFNDGQTPREGSDSDGRPHADTCDSPLAFLLRLYGMDGPAGMVQTSQWLVPRGLIVEAGPWNERLTVDDDGEFFARVVEKSNGVRLAAAGRVYYRKHPNQQSMSANWRRSGAHMATLVEGLDGRRAVLRRLGADDRGIRTLARFYCDWALAAYPRYPELSALALEGARACGVTRPVPQMPTPKGKLIQRFLGWRMARRIQDWMA